MKGFEGRYELRECAVGVNDGYLDFACDDTGRYGGLIKGGATHFSKWDPKKIITVNVVSANKLLDEILNQQQCADIVKIDVEGYEGTILSSIAIENLSRIDRIYAETTDGQEILGFSSESYGGLTRYYRI